MIFQWVFIPYFRILSFYSQIYITELDKDTHTQRTKALDQKAKPNKGLEYSVWRILQCIHLLAKPKAVPVYMVSW